MNDNEHYYEVVTPEYEVYAMSYDPPEPAEHGADWALVIATSAREAVGIAVKAWVNGESPCIYDSWLAHYSGARTYCQRQREDGCSPYTGVRAKVMRRGHGFEWRGEIEKLQEIHEEGHDACPDCDSDLQREMESE